MKIKSELGKEIEIDFKDINKVYVGKPNTCMCGCAGEYTYTNNSKEYGTKDRGYEVTDDEVNDKKVDRLLKKFVKHPDAAENLSDYIFTKMIGRKQYTIYLMKKED